MFALTGMIFPAFPNPSICQCGVEWSVIGVDSPGRALTSVMISWRSLRDGEFRLTRKRIHLELLERSHNLTDLKGFISTYCPAARSKLLER